VVNEQRRMTKIESDKYFIFVPFLYYQVANLRKKNDFVQMHGEVCDFFP
jgi:hypothetical protein